MFETFFGFTTKPFGKTPDPGFLYESPQHGEALARLEYAVEEKELSLLVGEIGSGKTTLSRALIDRIGEARPVILLINPRLTPAQLLRSIASGLGLQAARFRNDLLDQIHAKLFELYEAGREPVLIIDEAQLIPTKATFDEIRLLTNFQLDDQNLLSVLLIGQPELEIRLERAPYAALRQRIGMRYRLGPLSLDDTTRYVDHRIHVAGGSRNPFTDDAVRAMYAVSGGIPRLLNTLATTALLDAYGDDARTIDSARIAAAAKEHRLRNASESKEERIDQPHG
ncbi:MAG TPA: AAA family ATPase [Thermoanaerobaculia bacterium]|jgi:type II secretory pathway predicted ATPase ExeA|nr:AAA family ATPase [Thermoanaerobaculia bacterium]